jgi:hypothetical protein
MGVGRLRWKWRKRRKRPCSGGTDRFHSYDIFEFEKGRVFLVLTDRFHSYDIFEFEKGRAFFYFCAVIFCPSLKRLIFLNHMAEFRNRFFEEEKGRVEGGGGTTHRQTDKQTNRQRN